MSDYDRGEDFTGDAYQGNVDSAGLDTPIEDTLQQAEGQDESIDDDDETA